MMKKTKKRDSNLLSKAAAADYAGLSLFRINEMIRNNIIRMDGKGIPREVFFTTPVRLFMAKIQVKKLTPYEAAEYFGQMQLDLQ